MNNIFKKIIDPNHVFIIAEAGVNHNGDMKLARQLIDVAVEAGADAVKFQTFKTERLVALHAPKAKYQLKATCSSESQFEMLKRLELSNIDHGVLKKHCQKRGITFLSTPFDEESADFLDHLGVEVFKIPSGEITNLSFLTHVSQKGKPLIVSTGMSYLDEVKIAVKTIQHVGNNQIVLLHCVSQYPANPKDVNLRAMDAMGKVFGVPVGFSDHTLGIEIALAAVARGAQIIEKHFTLNRNLKGPDHKASLEPQELKLLVRGIRNIEIALGHGRKEPAESEKEVAQVARKSLVAAKDIPVGTILSDGLIAIKRPGNGLPPSMKSIIVGQKTKIFIKKDQLFSKGMFL